jgi:hypothetical protein
MKLNWLFYFGVGINAITILITVSELRMMSSTFIGLGGESIPMDSGMTTFGKLMSWSIPLVLLALVAGSFWLRSKNKILASNILVWLTALPMLAGFILIGGFAMLFILFGE